MSMADWTWRRDGLHNAIQAAYRDDAGFDEPAVEEISWLASALTDCGYFLPDSDSDLKHLRSHVADLEYELAEKTGQVEAAEAALDARDESETLKIVQEARIVGEPSGTTMIFDKAGMPVGQVKWDDERREVHWDPIIARGGAELSPVPMVVTPPPPHPSGVPGRFSMPTPGIGAFDKLIKERMTAATSSADVEKALADIMKRAPTIGRDAAAKREMFMKLYSAADVASTEKLFLEWSSAPERGETPEAPIRFLDSIGKPWQYDPATTHFHLEENAHIHMPLKELIKFYGPLKAANC